MIYDLVSIIMPCYNSGKYIGESIKSVQAQTYTNWELLIVDDLSNDDTIDVIRNYQKKDARIKVFMLKQKGGASIARNLAIQNANGRYIAFLDSDDLWDREKLSKQIKFMKKNKYAFTYTNYKIMTNNNVIKYTKSPSIVSYESMLKRNWIGCLTVIYDKKKCGLVQIPKIDKRNDYALWLKILQKIKYGYLLDEYLAVYRVNNGISQGSKFKLVKYHYYLFKRVMGFTKIKSLYYTLYNIFNYINQR